jgi:serine/threonine-protein kinase
MAPEYVRGEPIDRRADLFALGVVVWESLTARRLFRGASEAETLERLLHAPVPRLVEVVPGLPLALSDAVARMLEREPHARPGTAEEAAHALEQASAGMLASHAEVGRHVQLVAGEAIAKRRMEAQAPLAKLEATPEATAEPTVRDAQRPSRGRVAIAVVSVIAVGAAASAAVVALTSRTDAATATPSSPSTSSVAQSGGFSALTFPAPPPTEELRSPLPPHEI